MTHLEPIEAMNARIERENRARMAEMARAKEWDRIKPAPSSTFLGPGAPGHNWLIEGVLTAGEPCLLGGPKKSLKTSVALDLVVSLATGTPFLGRFPVAGGRPVPVVVFSGESGACTLRDTARRIAEARGVDLTGSPSYWSTALPDLGNPVSLDTLGRAVRDNRYNVVVIDPFYLCMQTAKVNMANLFEAGPLLFRLAEACRPANLILLHHARKDSQFNKERFRPLDLEDMAFSGIQEFARQWIMLNRRRPFKPDGETDLHNLWLSYGGSAGHRGLYVLEIDEGRLNPDFTGRRWDVRIMTSTDAKAAAARERAEKAEAGKADTAARRADKLLSVVPAVGTIGYEQARSAASFNASVMRATVTALVDAGKLECGKLPSGRGRSLRLPISAVSDN